MEHFHDVITRTALLEQLAERLGKLTEDHEVRLRWLERIALRGLGAIAILAVLVDVYDHVKR